MNKTFKINFESVKEFVVANGYTSSSDELFITEDGFSLKIFSVNTIVFHLLALKAAQNGFQLALYGVGGVALLLPAVIAAAIIADKELIVHGIPPLCQRFRQSIL